MPVKGYRVRYVVLKTGGTPPEENRRLIELLKEECEKHQPGFRFKAIHKGDEIIIRCPHKAVPSVRALLNKLNTSQPPYRVEIIGVSGTLRKAFSKFCRGNKPHGLGQRL
ncbi:MAG: hypothetical protein HA496_07730 [Thaumarchaeota archaeon]|jgi:RNase P/RNase MRP subunit POP5|nr:hypothetical protein [Nitrososphaerota archaeon]